MNNCFIILAAGESKRFKSKTPKPYYLYKGKPLFLHSIDKAKESNKFKKIILLINNKHKRFLKNTRLKNVKIITGGKNRSESSFKALKSILNNNISKVFIHDAARPNFSSKLISNLFKGLRKNKCVVPVIKTNNSVKLKHGNKIKNIDRNKIYLTQTPQAFDYKTLLNLQKETNLKITDDANLFIEANKIVKFLNGPALSKTISSDSLLKTTSEDASSSKGAFFSVIVSIMFSNNNILSSKSICFFSSRVRCLFVFISPFFKSSISFLKSIIIFFII